MNNKQNFQIYPPSALFTARATSKKVIEYKFTVFIRVRVPRAQWEVPNVLVKWLASLLEVHGCAALPSVHTCAKSVLCVAVAILVNRQINIVAGILVAAIVGVALYLTTTSRSAVTL